MSYLGKIGVVLAIAGGLAYGPLCWAGPPFVTDDPEPVEYQHFELYFAGSFSQSRDGQVASAPMVEFNYGIIENVQLHIIGQGVYNHPKDEHEQYGLGDTELGIKYRFVQETDTRPMVGVFPLVELPTGAHSRGLGNGKAQVFLPVWVQKSFGADKKWTTYGGGGWWYNPGSDNRNYWRFGWLLQRELTEQLTLGGEVYHETRSSTAGEGHTACNLGGFYNVNEHHHLLFSFGRDIDGPSRFQMYLAYQLTK